MSVSSTIRSRLNVVRQVIPASSPSFSLACNVYTSLPSATANSVHPEKVPPGVKPPLLFTHANGFHKELWEPVMSRLGSTWKEHDMYAFDCRNQGDSAVLNKDVLEDTFDWLTYAKDVLSVVDNLGLKRPLGVGHSFGASAIILAELLRPGTFSAIVAVDPTMFPLGVKITGPIADHPMAQITLRRRDNWKDRAEAKAKLLEKEFFRVWHPEALERYLEFGMRDFVRPDGTSGVTLKCPKFQEAVTFAAEGSAIHDAFEKLGDVNIPIHCIVGETSDINPPDLVIMKVERCKYGSADTVVGAGHLLTMEKPEETANYITAFLDRFAASRQVSLDSPRPRL